MKNQIMSKMKNLLGLGLVATLVLFVGISTIPVEASMNQKAGETTLPSKYSSAEQGYVSPVKNQGSENICWTYAAMAVYESMLMKNGIPFTKPYSETTLAQWAVPNGTGTYFNRDKSVGSVAEAAISYMISWMGPKNGEELVHQELPNYAVTDILYVDEKDRNSIKQNIYDYGAVTGSISFETRFYGADKTNYFCKNEQTENFMHAITVVGWDDNYSKSNFNNTYGAPENDGAWLVKNSYGNWVNSIGGYLWISYEDFYLFKSAQGKIGNLYYTPTKFMKTDETTGMYQIEDFGPTDQPNFLTDSSVTFMNIMDFDNEDDYIDKITFESYMKGNRYELYYIPLESNGIPTKQEDNWTKIGQGEITHNGIMSSDITDYKLPKGKAAIGIRVFKKDSLESENIRFGVVDTIAGGSFFVHEYIDNTSYVYKNNQLTEMADYITDCTENANLFIKVISKNPTADKVTYEVGDVNRDKVVDLKDAVRLYEYANGFEMPSTEILQIGDMDVDGQLTKKDVQLLQNKLTNSKLNLTYQEKTEDDKMYINEQEVQVGSIITYTAKIKDATNVPMGMAGYTYYDNNILTLLSNMQTVATLKQQFPKLAKEQFAVNADGNQEIVGESSFKTIKYNAVDIFYDYLDFKNEGILIQVEFEVAKYVPGRHTIASGITECVYPFDFKFDGVIVEEIVVDNTELADYSAVNRAIALIPKDLSGYTDESVAKLQDVLDSIIYNKRKEEQAVVDSYVKLIEDAIAQLVTKPENPGPDAVDKTELQELIVEAESKTESDYTKESWDIFAEALSSATEISQSQDVTQQQVDNAKQDLINAIAQLKKQENPAPDPVDKTKLQVLLVEAESKIETDYTKESWSVFAEAFSKARAINQNQEATQEQVDTAKQDLINAIAQLKKQENPAPDPVDKTKLQELLVEAESKIETDYTKESWSVFAAAFSKARAINQNQEATQEQVDTAKQDLINAIAQLKKQENPAPDPVDKTKLQELLVKAESKKEKSYTKKSWNIFVDALNNARTINQDKDASKEEVESARQKLQEAITQLKVIGWNKIGNKWYYLDVNGKMVTGWKQVSKKWYYLNADGSMATSWKQVDNKWYYLNANGSMATGWKQVSKKWYYLNANGSMATGWKQVSKKWYYLNTDGSMVTGWKKIKNNWYYFNGSGKMLTGWIKDKTKHYYLYPNGSMASNKWIGRYFVNASGVWTKTK